MKEFNIDPHKLDMQQYMVLQNITTYRVLTAVLLDMEKANEDGTYEERWKQYAKNQEKELFDWQTRIIHNKKSILDSRTNNRRFSHRYPKGVDVDDPRSDPSLQAFLEVKKIERARAERQVAKAVATAGSPFFPKPDELEPKKTWYRIVFVVPVQSIKNWGWSYIIFSLLIFGPFIGGFTWANMSSTPKSADRLA